MCHLAGGSVPRRWLGRQGPPVDPMVCPAAAADPSAAADREDVRGARDARRLGGDALGRGSGTRSGIHRWLVLMTGIDGLVGRPRDGRSGGPDGCGRSVAAPTSTPQARRPRCVAHGRGSCVAVSSPIVAHGLLRDEPPGQARDLRSASRRAGLGRAWAVHETGSPSPVVFRGCRYAMKVGWVAPSRGDASCAARGTFGRDRRYHRGGVRGSGRCDPSAR